MTSSFCSTAVRLAVLFAVFAPATQVVHAQIAKPFKISGQGTAPLGLPLPGQDARPHGIVGQATHLGRHTGQGTLQTNSLSVHADGTITGSFQSSAPFKFIAANGDVLTCHYGANSQGSYTLTPLNATGLYAAQFVAEFVPVPSACTGRFAGVTGSWTMIAVTEPIQLGPLGFVDPIRYTWYGEGVLTFKKGG